MGKISQQQYAEILFNDLGFSISQRRQWLRDYYDADYLDELQPGQVSKIIEELKERKERGGVEEEADDAR